MMHSFTPHDNVGKRACLTCGDLSDAASNFGPDSRAPKDGDLSVCINCGGLNIFDGDNFRAPTDEERTRAMAEPELVYLIALIHGRGRIRE